MVYPPVVVVNTDDKVIGSAPLSEAWNKGLIHRIAFVVLEDKRGRILLQKRAPNMQLFAGRWDTIGGHVDITPDYEETARLELQEEMGITGPYLAEVAHVFTDDPYDNGVRAKRFIKVFWAHYDGELGELGKDEVTEAHWFTMQEIAALAAKHPDQVAEGLHRCLPYILDTSLRP
jgi:8-oxo-dGTP pyrophosphatase MutT (NUDIX family)